MVPRLSLPTMTSALATPGNGSGTTWMKNDSHLPVMGEASIFPSRINSVNHRASANRADDDGIGSLTFRVVRDGRRQARDARNIRPQIARGANDSGPIIRIHINGRNGFSLNNGKIAAVGNVLDALNLAKSKTVGDKNKKDQAGQWEDSVQFHRFQRILIAASMIYDAKVPVQV